MKPPNISSILVAKHNKSRLTIVSTARSHLVNFENAHAHSQTHTCSECKELFGLAHNLKMHRCKKRAYHLRRVKYFKYFCLWRQWTIFLAFWAYGGCLRLVELKTSTIIQIFCLWRQWTILLALHHKNFHGLGLIDATWVLLEVRMHRRYHYTFEFGAYRCHKNRDCGTFDVQLMW